MNDVTSPLWHRKTGSGPNLLVLQTVRTQADRAHRILPSHEAYSTVRGDVFPTIDPTARIELIYGESDWGPVALRAATRQHHSGRRPGHLRARYRTLLVPRQSIGRHRRGAGMTLIPVRSLPWSA